MTCPRCGGMMRAEEVYGDEQITFWSCYRCGETFDRQVLKNRERHATKPPASRSTRERPSPPARLAGIAAGRKSAAEIMAFFLNAPEEGARPRP